MNDFYEQVKLIGEKAELYEHIGLVHKFEKKQRRGFQKISATYIPHMQALICYKHVPHWR